MDGNHAFQPEKTIDDLWRAVRPRVAQRFGASYRERHGVERIDESIDVAWSNIVVNPSENEREAMAKGDVAKLATFVFVKTNDLLRRPPKRVTSIANIDPPSSSPNAIGDEDEEKRVLEHIVDQVITALERSLKYHDSAKKKAEFLRFWQNHENRNEVNINLIIKEYMALIAETSNKNHARSMSSYYVYMDWLTTKVGSIYANRRPN